VAALVARWGQLGDGTTTTRGHHQVPARGARRRDPAQMAQIIDVAPTVLALAGVPDTVPRQGRSVVRLLNGWPTEWRSSVLFEYYTDRVFPRALDMGYQAVRTERHRYVHYVDLPGMDEIYDLEADPYELDNLVGKPAGEQLLPTFKADLERLQRETWYRADFKGYR
jgi:N-acetylglucosamine-6-sulfatase